MSWIKDGTFIAFSERSDGITPHRCYGVRVDGNNEYPYFVDDDGDHREARVRSLGNLEGASGYIVSAGPDAVTPEDPLKACIEAAKVIVAHGGDDCVIKSGAGCRLSVNARHFLQDVGVGVIAHTTYTFTDPEPAV